MSVHVGQPPLDAVVVERQYRVVDTEEVQDGSERRSRPESAITVALQRVLARLGFSLQFRAPPKCFLQIEDLF